MKSKEIGFTQKKAAYWQDHIRSWEQSGLSRRCYCKAKSLALSTFSYWQLKINKNDADRPRFYPLAVLPDFSGVTKGKSKRLRLNVCEMRFQLEIPDDFSEPELKRLIFTLEQL